MLRNFEWAARRIAHDQKVDDSVIQAACEELEIFAMASEDPWRKDMIASMQEAIKNRDKAAVMSVMNAVADMESFARSDLETGAKRAISDLVDLVDGRKEVAHKIINDMCDREFLLFFASPEDKMAVFINENMKDILVLRIEFSELSPEEVSQSEIGEADVEGWFDEHEDIVFDTLLNRIGLHCHPENLLGGKLVICKKEG